MPDQDLLCLGRPLEDSIIVDNSPHSYVFQPENALPIGTFIDDPNDREARALTLKPQNPRMQQTLEVLQPQEENRRAPVPQLSKITLSLSRGALRLRLTLTPTACYPSGLAWASALRALMRRLSSK